MIYIDLSIYRLFHEVHNSLSYIGSNDNGLERIWKARVVYRFETLSPHVTGGNGEDQETPEGSRRRSRIQIGRISRQYYTVSQIFRLPYEMFRMYNRTEHTSHLYQKHESILFFYFNVSHPDVFF